MPTEKNGGRLHHLTETVSDSGLTVRKRRWRLMGLLNTEATRDPQKDDNKVRDQQVLYSFISLNLSMLTIHFQITVTVPITLMTPMSESGQAIYPENHIHKVFTSIFSNVEDVSVISENLEDLELFTPPDLLPGQQPDQQ